MMWNRGFVTVSIRERTEYGRRRIAEEAPEGIGRRDLSPSSV